MPSYNSNRRLISILFLAQYYLTTFALVAVLYSTPSYWAQPYHTSALSGEEWVQELIHGHPDRIYCELGMRLHVFIAFVAELHRCGLRTSLHGVTVEEQAAIFLYSCVTGLSIRHVGERFQRANATISYYFKEVLFTVTSTPFYSDYVVLPSAHEDTPPEIRNNPKFWPYFKDAVGAIDGTHIECCPSAEDRHAARNRKGFLSQNCLACCSFDMFFKYFASGHDGASADGFMYERARVRDFPIPAGKFYIADAGFGVCDSLLVPYRGVRYHLREWGAAGVRPANREELFNLRHASLRNVVERIFGVVKRRWAILTRPQEYQMWIQKRVPPAIASVHNFIMKYDPANLEDYIGAYDPQPGATEVGDLASGIPTRAEKVRAESKRDDIAQQMWEDYQRLVQERVIDGLE